MLIGSKELISGTPIKINGKNTVKKIHTHAIMEARRINPISGKNLLTPFFMDSVILSPIGLMD
ncbi:MAG TPA: hypothetical protein PLU14_03630, partial [Caldisericia bacterium]|nr:hypothetical protein [Caldisericia bacterium]